MGWAVCLIVSLVATCEARNVCNCLGIGVTARASELVFSGDGRAQGVDNAKV